MEEENFSFFTRHFMQSFYASLGEQCKSNKIQKDVFLGNF